MATIIHYLSVLKNCIISIRSFIRHSWYEVSRIYIMRPHNAFGIDFEESEIITSNDQFYADGSGAFRSLENALKHLDKLSDKYLRMVTVEPKTILIVN
jgi:hypothetical protein